MITIRRKRCEDESTILNGYPCRTCLKAWGTMISRILRWRWYWNIWYLDNRLTLVWVHNISGSTKDSVRVDLCGTTLKGAASKWYLDEAEAWNRPNKYWLFEDLVCAMYKRFIHEVMAQNAAVNFDHTLYSKLKGALAFYNDLKQYPGHMVISPDKYSMKKKFL